MSDSFVEIVRTCATCGKEFIARTRWHPNGAAKHCSQKCRYASRRNGVNEFWARINKTDSCWLWTGLPAADGYGCLRFDGVPWRAHRLSWTLIKGQIPDGLDALHNCPGGDNKLCVNPDHLFLGTQADNNADNKKKGGTTRGERSATAKLTDGVVLALRADFVEHGGSFEEIAARHGNINRASVRDAVRGRTWAHLPGAVFGPWLPSWAERERRKAFLISPGTDNRENPLR